MISCSTSIASAGSSRRASYSSAWRASKARRRDGSAELCLALEHRDQRAVVAAALVQRLERVEGFGVFRQVLEQLAVVLERKLLVLQARAGSARDAAMHLGLQLAVLHLGRDLAQQRDVVGEARRASPRVGRARPVDSDSDESSIPARTARAMLSNARLLSRRPVSATSAARFSAASLSGTSSVSCNTSSTAKRRSYELLAS